MEMFKLCDENQAKEEGLFTTEDMIQSFVNQGMNYTDMLKVFWEVINDEESLIQQSMETGWTVNHIREGFINLVDYIIRECI